MLPGRVTIRQSKLEGRKHLPTEIGPVRRFRRPDMVRSRSGFVSWLGMWYDRLVR
jgi:hypothetical protein